MDYRRKRPGLGPDVIRALRLPDYLWSALEEHHGYWDAYHVRGVLGLSESDYWILFERCERPYKVKELV